MAALAGPSAELAPRSAFRAGADIHSPFAPWLLGIAIVAWIGELIVRDRKTTAPTFTSMGEATRASPVVRA